MRYNKEKINKLIFGTMNIKNNLYYTNMLSIIDKKINKFHLSYEYYSFKFCSSLFKKKKKLFF